MHMSPHATSTDCLVPSMPCKVQCLGTLTVPTLPDLVLDTRSGCSSGCITQLNKARAPESPLSNTPESVPPFEHAAWTRKADSNTEAVLADYDIFCSGYSTDSVSRRFDDKNASAMLSHNIFDIPAQEFEEPLFSANDWSTLDLSPWQVKLEDIYLSTTIEPPVVSTIGPRAQLDDLSGSNTITQTLECASTREPLSTFNTKLFLGQRRMSTMVLIVQVDLRCATVNCECERSKCTQLADAVDNSVSISIEDKPVGNQGSQITVQRSRKRSREGNDTGTALKPRKLRANVQHVNPNLRACLMCSIHKKSCDHGYPGQSKRGTNQHSKLRACSCECLPTVRM